MESNVPHQSEMLTAPLERIVVGFDGSEESRDALRLAEMLRVAYDAELVVALVDEIDPLIETSLIGLETREKYSSQIFDQAAEQLLRKDFNRRTAIGSAPRGLDWIATDTEADLIVIGSTHRGKVGRVLPGSVGSRLLSGAPCAVAVAPRGYAQARLSTAQTIGVGYDGEPESKAALQTACELASAMRASVRVIAVLPVEEPKPARISSTALVYARHLRKHFKEQLDAAGRACDEAVDHELVLEEGDPAEVLAAQSDQLDLLVVGSRGYGPLRRALLGGVAGKLIGLTACPVLVTPRSGAHAHDPIATDINRRRVSEPQVNHRRKGVMFKTIVLALDGSEGSDRIVPLGIALAMEHDGRLVIAHADEKTVLRTEPQSKPGEEDVEARLRKLAQRLTDDGLETSFEVRSVMIGGPAPAIVEIADQADANLILCGTRGHSAVGGLLLGSVTQRLLHIAHQPVLVVPESAQLPYAAPVGLTSTASA